MNRRVIGALLRKELLDVSRNRGALLPVVLVTAIALVVPFVVTIVVPGAVGQRLSDDMDLVRISAIIDPGRTLTTDGRVQLFFFQQFLLLFLLTPTTGALASGASTTRRPRGLSSRMRPCTVQVLWASWTAWKYSKTGAWLVTVTWARSEHMPPASATWAKTCPRASASDDSEKRPSASVVVVAFT